MKQVYLFDWGDTLMVDDPMQAGHMKDWPEVSEVAGAAEMLAALAQSAVIYVATGAENTTIRMDGGCVSAHSLKPVYFWLFLPRECGLCEILARLLSHHRHYARRGG